MTTNPRLSTPDGPPCQPGREAVRDPKLGEFLAQVARFLEVDSATLFLVEAEPWTEVAAAGPRSARIGSGDLRPSEVAQARRALDERRTLQTATPGGSNHVSWVPVERGATPWGLLALERSSGQLSPAAVERAAQLAQLLALFGVARENPGAEVEMATLREVERSCIERTLVRTAGKLYGADGAARILGINASTLRSRMVKLGLGGAREFRRRHVNGRTRP